MYEVHIYVSVSTKSPKVLHRTGFYRIETQTIKGPAAIEHSFQAEGSPSHAELTTINAALRRITSPCRITIHTDSIYVISAFRDNHIWNWAQSGWKKYGGKPLANKEEWKEMVALLKGRAFKIQEERE